MSSFKYISNYDFLKDHALHPCALDESGLSTGMVADRVQVNNSLSNTFLNITFFRKYHKNRQLQIEFK